MIMVELRIVYLFNKKLVKNKCPEHSRKFSSEQLYTKFRILYQNGMPDAQRSGNTLHVFEQTFLNTQILKFSILSQVTLIWDK